MIQNRSIRSAKMASRSPSDNCGTFGPLRKSPAMNCSGLNFNVSTPVHSSLGRIGQRLSTRANIIPLFTSVNSFLKIIIDHCKYLGIYCASKMLLTIQQAAERLELSRQRVHLLISQGRIKAHRVGREYLIRPADLERFRLIPRKGGRPTNGHRKAAK